MISSSIGTLVHQIAALPVTIAAASWHNHILERWIDACGGGRMAMSKVVVRYIVDDVDAAISFYTKLLGFQLVMHPAPPFAIIALGELQLCLSQPGAGGGGQAMPNGQLPKPGGWNRFQIAVDDLERTVAELKAAGGQFRSDIVTGVGGKQIVLDDPSGNPIELFQYS
jgi:catechol 2,3-dioxygenase-like lactoylglutathione lyase family enzyme